MRKKVKKKSKKTKNEEQNGISLVLDINTQIFFVLFSQLKYLGKVTVDLHTL